MARHTRDVPVTILMPSGLQLNGDLHIPAGAHGLVVFAHGSGSSRFSPRNRQVATALQEAGLATLLLDLLTPEEEQIDAVTRAIRFDIELLAHRLVAVLDWLAAQAQLAALRVGLFGASTGAAAALMAAAARPGRVGAVVSRGGRPDLAGSALQDVHAPTLLIVGSLDVQVLAMNQSALAHLPAEKRLEIVAGATHLFEEPGMLDVVAGKARDWFALHLAQLPTNPAPGA